MHVDTFKPAAEAPDRNLALELVRVTEAGAIAASRWKAADGTPLRRRAAKGSLAAAGMAVGWAFVAWMTTAAAVALTALTVALMAA